MVNNNYYEAKVRCIKQIKALILNSDSITVDAVKDYVRNTYGFGARVVHETVDELVRAGRVVVAYGVIKKPYAAEESDDEGAGEE